MSYNVILIYNLAAIGWIVLAFIDCWIIVNSVRGKLTMNSLMDRFTLHRLYPTPLRFVFSERLLTFIIPTAVISLGTQLPLPTLALLVSLACTVVNLRFCRLYLWVD